MQSLLWKTNLNPKDWDSLLTKVAGHPLQSAAWGEAKKTKDNYWVAFLKEQPVFMVRFEERSVAKLFKIAWVPKGPIVVEQALEAQAWAEFLTKLKRHKFQFCLTFPWKAIKSDPRGLLPQTIWVDLSLGKEALWQQSNKGFRHSVKQALESGLQIEQSQDKEVIQNFFSLCHQLSEQKKFTLNLSLRLLQSLLETSYCEHFESHLFVAYHQQQFCGGAFIIRCGESVHYFWGAVDRRYSKNKLQVGEVLQWTIIEWALAKKCKLYDLEGIDIKNNPGVFQFKNKLKGKIITLPGLQIFSLNPLAKIALNCFKYGKRLFSHCMPSRL